METKNTKDIKDIKDTLNISIPEPNPINSGTSVYPITISNISKIYNTLYNFIYFDKSGNDISNDIKSKYKLEEEEVYKILESRYNFGLKKYSQPLMSKDGRDDIEDCAQELADAIQYLSKAIYNNKNIDKLKVLIRLLNYMIDDTFNIFMNKDE